MIYHIHSIRDESHQKNNLFTCTLYIRTVTPIPFQLQKPSLGMMELSHTNDITPAQDFKQLQNTSSQKNPEQPSFTVTMLTVLLCFHVGSLTPLGLVSAIWAIPSLVPGLFLPSCLLRVPHSVISFGHF